MITLELQLDEAQMILNALHFDRENITTELIDYLEEHLAREIEIQSLDLNECEGGACKL